MAGWGTTSEGGSTSDRMREVSVPVVSDAKAKKAYSSLSLQLRYFPKVMVAAGQKGKDSCQGDSGGPLFNPGANSTTQVGIVSYGHGCARAASPAYTPRPTIPTSGRLSSTLLSSNYARASGRRLANESEAVGRTEPTASILHLTHLVSAEEHKARWYPGRSHRSRQSPFAIDRTEVFGYPVIRVSVFSPPA